MKIDRFTKYALITYGLDCGRLWLSVHMLVIIVGGNVATDDKVNNMARAAALPTYDNRHYHRNWGVTGEYVGFFIAGCVGGFIVGYIFPSIFNSNAFSRRKNNDDMNG